MANISYKDAGVDIDAGNAFVDAIKSDVKSTFDSNVIGGIGSFAGAYALPTGYKEPVLLSATDGVGTKLMIAIESGKFDTVGIDLVAMCVNDLICNNGVPMFFLDYYATGKLLPENAKDVVAGIAEGCRRSECALVGGETAEMPGFYGDGEYAVAGFIVGSVEKDKLLDGSRIQAGHVLIGLPSMTHSFDMNQRYVELNVAASSTMGSQHSLTVDAPPDARVAPPGLSLR